MEHSAFGRQIPANGSEEVRVPQEEHWRKLVQALENDPGFQEFRSHELPLARIKKIMKSDEDVSMISSEAPILFAKACELFILDLTIRAWTFTDSQKRRTIQRSDIAHAISESPLFDFLVDIVPPDTNSRPSRPSQSNQDSE